MEGMGDWEEALDGDVMDDLPSLDWDEMSAGPSLPGLEHTPLTDEHPVPDDMRVTEWGAMPWGPGSGEGYQPWAQASTDSPPMGDSEIEETQPQYAAQNAHPDVDPMTMYDRDSYEPPIDQRQTYGAGIFDLPDQGAVFNENDGIFANNYALPAYIAREPEMDVFETEALDVNTGLPRVAQVNASGVQLMRNDPQRAWSPFAPPPYGGSNPMNVQPYVPPTLHDYGERIVKFGHEGARALLDHAAHACPNDPNRRGYYICQMIDQMLPQMSPRALAAVADLRNHGYPGNPVELVVGHVLMHVAVCDLSDKARANDASGRLPRLDKLKASPELARAAQQRLGVLVHPKRAAAAVKGFQRTQEAQQIRGMLGTEAPSPDAPAPAANGEGMSTMTVLKYAGGAVAIGGLAWVGYDWWQKRKKTRS